jgi:WD40 repeat protein
MRHSVFRLTILACLAVAGLSANMAAIAAPVVVGGFTIEPYVNGIGVISGMTIGPDRKLYAVDYSGRVLRIEDDRSITILATGVPYINGIAFTSNGRLFVAGGLQQAVYEVTSGAINVFATTGLSYPTSIAARGDRLFVSNSGNGTISRVKLDGSVKVVLGGFSVPNGPFGLSVKAGKMYFIDHGTGGVYSWSFTGTPRLLTSVTAFGGTFTGSGFEKRLFITDTEIGDLMSLDSNGALTVFASGFSAKVTPPAIGPNGIAFNGTNRLYVGDGNSIYLIRRSN